MKPTLHALHQPSMPTVCGAAWRHDGLGFALVVTARRKGAARRGADPLG